MSLPSDPVLLLSVVNTQLRDKYTSLDELANVEGTTAEEIINKLELINYHYDTEQKQFIQLSWL